jgi:hypothetical protein
MQRSFDSSCELSVQPNTPRHRDGSAGDANYGVIGERYATSAGLIRALPS